MCTILPNHYFITKKIRKEQNFGSRFPEKETKAY